MIVGQDAMLERVLVALLVGGHVLLEGVPGLAKTLTVKTLADVVSGSFKRVQFTPDLVPADLVGTRIYRPDTGEFSVELGPVLCNFLLADEINRAPAKVQSALLEVMQERQVTIGGETYRVPEPFLVLATQNPIESEGTYPLPEAQTDRFLMKVLVDYPAPSEEAVIVERLLQAPAEVAERLSGEQLLEFRDTASRVFVDSDAIRYAVTLADATRRPARYGLEDIEPYIEFGASPRGPIGLVQSARALALLRGRRHAVASDVRDLASDVLRHRLVLSYEALSDAVTRRRSPRTGCSRSSSPMPGRPMRPRRASRRDRARPHSCAWQPGPWATPSRIVEALDLALVRRTAGMLPGEHRAPGVGAGTELAQLRVYQPGDDVRQLDPAASARTGLPHVRLHVPERLMTAWIVLDVSPSMAFGTGLRLKSDVAAGAAALLARLAVRRGGRAGLMLCGGQRSCSSRRAGFAGRRPHRARDRRRRGRGRSGRRRQPRPRPRPAEPPGAVARHGGRRFGLPGRGRLGPTAARDRRCATRLWRSM